MAFRARLHHTCVIFGYGVFGVPFICVVARAYLMSPPALPLEGVVGVCHRSCALVHDRIRAHMCAASAKLR